MLSKRFRIVGTSKMRFSPCAVCLRQNSNLEQIFVKSPQQTATRAMHGGKALLSDTRNPKPYNRERKLQRFHEGVLLGGGRAPSPARPPSPRPAFSRVPCSLQEERNSNEETGVLQGFKKKKTKY
jgi:hypothetical protein